MPEDTENVALNECRKELEEAIRNLGKLRGVFPVHWIMVWASQDLEPPPPTRCDKCDEVHEDNHIWYTLITPPGQPAYITTGLITTAVNRATAEAVVGTLTSGLPPQL